MNCFELDEHTTNLIDDLMKQSNEEESEEQNDVLGNG